MTESAAATVHHRPTRSAAQPADVPGTSQTAQIIRAAHTASWHMVTYVQGLLSADMSLHPPIICAVMQPDLSHEAVLHQVQQPTQQQVQCQRLHLHLQRLCQSSCQTRGLQSKRCRPCSPLQCPTGLSGPPRLEEDLPSFPRLALQVSFTNALHSLHAGEVCCCKPVSEIAADHSFHECHLQKVLISLHASHHIAVISMQLMIQLMMQVQLDHYLARIATAGALA